MERTPVTLTLEEAHSLAHGACLGAGADEASARSLAAATVSAHRANRPEVGFAHLCDYLHAFREGRIHPAPRPGLERPFPAFLESDADGGLAQLGFDLAFDALVEAASTLGIALFVQRNSFTSGELGFYVRRLAAEGLIALAFTNANAFVAPAPGLPRLFSTNPMAFAYPLGKGRPPLLVDQSSASTAFVNLSAAAARGETLSAGMAVDAEGQPTTDPLRAMAGALLPFGGRKGANIALMVEMMSAGLAGGQWSADMPDFRSGAGRLDVGLSVIAINPGPDPQEVAARGAAFVDRLRAAGVHVPGLGHDRDGERIVLDAPLHAEIASFRDQAR